jgi:aryl-alcohol dehydrogenase-like predicted oxidoreductase
MERLGGSFGFLEGARRKGWVRYYGLATWDSLRVGPEQEGHFDLEDALTAAREAGGAEHGFRFVQFPFNLVMPEAATRATQRAGRKAQTVFDACAALGLGTFSSVPLLQGRLPAAEALRFARSAPNHLAPLVGHKESRHVEDNLAVAREPPLSPGDFSRILKGL